MADAPFYLQWHITSRCNLRCAHCYQSDYADQISESLFQEGLEKFGRHLSRAGAKGQIGFFISPKSGKGAFVLDLGESGDYDVSGTLYWH